MKMFLTEFWRFLKKTKVVADPHILTMLLLGVVMLAQGTAVLRCLYFV